MTHNPSSTGRIRSLQRIIPEAPANVEEDLRGINEARKHYDGAARIVELCRALPCQQVALLTRLVPLLAEEDQLEILAEVLKLAPRDLVQQIERELLSQSANNTNSHPSEAKQ
jgi:hypothetical protein